jgi:hypothetical protein
MIDAVLSSYLLGVQRSEREPGHVAFGSFATDAFCTSVTLCRIFLKADVTGKCGTVKRLHALARHSHRACD